MHPCIWCTTKAHMTSHKGVLGCFRMFLGCFEPQGEQVNSIKFNQMQCKVCLLISKYLIAATVKASSWCLFVPRGQHPRNDKQKTAEPPPVSDDPLPALLPPGKSRRWNKAPWLHSNAKLLFLIQDLSTHEILL